MLEPSVIKPERSTIPAEGEDHADNGRVSEPPDGEPESAEPVSATVPHEGDNATVDLARIGWLATVVACLIAVLVLVLQGYYGYAGVTLAVAISAGINLL
jgi:hypothetical protein